MDLGLRFFIRNECFWIWVFACLYVCWLYLFGFFFIVFFLGFVKPICRARVSKMAQLALKVGDTNSNSPCLSNLDFILIMASNKLLHWLFFSLFFFILF